jgi:hypothetical protein
VLEQGVAGAVVSGSGDNLGVKAHSG